MGLSVLLSFILGVSSLIWTSGTLASDLQGQRLSPSPANLLQTQHDIRDGHLTTRTAQTYVPNGEPWYDVDGNMIQAWGGSIYQEASTYYWIGQNSPSTGGLPSNITALANLYKSTDLLNWQKIATPITVYTPDVKGNLLLTYSRLERPKLMRSSTTGQYVIWAHWELANSYTASEVIVATASSIEGPYTITNKGHHRPGAGFTSPTAMGDRVGGLRYDWSTTAKNSTDTTHPYMPVLAGYPPTVTQYGSPATVSPYNPAYLPASTYGVVTLSGFRFSSTLKAIAVVMTPWNATLYNQYVSDYSVSAATYIVRYPTTSRSSVATTVFNLGDPGTERSSLVTPVIAPTLNESKSTAAVLVKSGDAAFITVATENATIYYTTDGSTPLSTNASQIYAAGTRITVSGSSGDKLVVKAIAVKSGQSSTVVTQTYQIASDPSQVPIFAPIINWTSGTYSQTSIAFQTNGIRIYCPSYMTNCYYTVDDLDPDPPMLGDNLGFGSRDQTIWQDPQDGLHYQITATDNLYVRVWQLNDDLTDVVPESEFDVFVGQSREAPALVRNGGASGKYVYIVTSTQSGWYPNQAMYKRATSIQAGFSLSRDSKSGYRDGTSLWSTLTPIGDASTFGSQSTWILNIGTDVSPSYVYIGDRYNVPSLAQSSYVFTPLYIDDNTAGENGVSGSGNMTLVFDPQPAIQVASNRIAQPPWRLLSLNKPVSATSSIALTAAQAAAGTYNYSASVANDGVNFDENAYDAVQQYYLPVTVPYFWQVDLQKSYALSWIGLSFRSVSGSDAVARYTASASKDNSTWTLLVDNTGNALPGYKSHMVSGRYRYVRIDVSSIYDVVHGTSAAWEAGLYEASVYGSC